MMNAQPRPLSAYEFVEDGDGRWDQMPGGDYYYKGDVHARITAILLEIDRGADIATVRRKLAALIAP